MDSSDLLGCENSGDRPTLWSWQKTNRSGDKLQRWDATADNGMLRLNVKHHDDDDDDDDDVGTRKAPNPLPVS